MGPKETPDNLSSTSGAKLLLRPIALHPVRLIQGDRTIKKKDRCKDFLGELRWTVCIWRCVPILLSPNPAFISKQTGREGWKRPPFDPEVCPLELRGTEAQICHRSSLCGTVKRADVSGKAPGGEQKTKTEPQKKGCFPLGHVEEFGCVGVNYPEQIPPIVLGLLEQGLVRQGRTVTGVTGHQCLCQRMMQGLFF